MTTTVHTHIADLSSDQKAALAAALRARVTAPSPQQNAENEAPGYDVLILGGGPAGLTLALQLHTESPGTKIAVIERLTHPVSETTHKVGESTVEIAAHYLRDVLGLQDHLERDQLRKFGLRMFFSTDDNTDIADRVELGSSVFPPLCTYQLDRGRLENELGRRCLDAGIKFLDGTKIIDVEFDHPLHRALVDGPDGEQQITARWVVDASGRSQLLHRFDQGQRTAVGHSASAAWFRIAHPVDVNTWSDKTDWVTRTFEGDRALSTNHLMGDGYWVWLIRLATGSTSIGIVADSHTHPFVKGQQELPSGGHETCPLTVTGTARWWPWDLPKGLRPLPTRGIQFNGLTPWPASAWVSRTLSPLVWQTWAWCRSRSTVAVASVLGISSSNPDGCRFELIATERFS